MSLLFEVGGEGRVECDDPPCGFGDGEAGDCSCPLSNICGVNDVAWARLPEGIKPITVDFRLGAVRGFARYLHAIDPAHQIPPPGLLAVPRRRPAPYIYTPDQIDEVLCATRRLNPPLRAVTYRTLLGLLATTGMRLGSVRADPHRRRPRRRHGHHPAREARPHTPGALHPSVTAALRSYATKRDRLSASANCDRFFVSVTGRPLRRGEVERVFREITAVIGLRTDTVHPRIHDLRHSFAVRTLIDGHRNGADISSLLPVLSTYLGHYHSLAVPPSSHPRQPGRSATSTWRQRRSACTSATERRCGVRI